MLLNVNVDDLCWVVTYIGEDSETDYEDDVVKAAHRLIAQMKPQLPDAILHEMSGGVGPLAGLWAPHTRRPDRKQSSHVPATTGDVMPLELDLRDVCWVLKYVTHGITSGDDVVTAGDRIIAQLKSQVPKKVRKKSPFC